MRHAPVTLAGQIREHLARGEEWDVLLCCDMLNLAELRGLVPQIAHLPAVVYFHENQLTYPVRPQHAHKGDLHFAYTNFTTALAGDEIWFNSQFHLDEFLTSLRAFLGKMPDYQHTEAVETIRKKAKVHPPGITGFPLRAARNPGPLRILWAARFEFDKNPEDFFAAIRQLREQGVSMRLSVIGQEFRQSPEVFSQMKKELADVIDHWGYQESVEAYRAALAQADVVVSTAVHEFFGISMVEAISAGAYPILPERLAYPQVLDLDNHPDCKRFFYDGSVEALTQKLLECSRNLQSGDLWHGCSVKPSDIVARFTWPVLAPQFDTELSNIAVTRP